MKLQGDRLNRGWREQPTRGTNKGSSRPHFAKVEDLLTRARCFKCGELGHLARNCSQKKEDDASLFSGDKDLVTESEVFFSGMVCDDYNAEAVFFAKKEETSLCDPNVEEKKETFLCDTVAEKKEETFLHNPNVSSRDRGETFLFSGSDSRVVCPQTSQSQQESCAGVDHREFLVHADHIRFWALCEFSWRGVVDGS